jgi:hypothetical protein
MIGWLHPNRFPGWLPKRLIVGFEVVITRIIVVVMDRVEIGIEILVLDR